MVRIKTRRLTRNPVIRSPGSTSRSPGGRWFFQGDGASCPPSWVGRAMHRAATAPDDRLRHKTGQEAPGSRRCAIRGETTNGWPGARSADLRDRHQSYITARYLL